MGDLPKILIVEDEFVVAFSLQRSLTRLGYPLCPLAASGEMAIQLAGEHHPRLALMDVQLTGEIGGLEAARTIAECWTIPVIFMTGHSDDQTLTEMKSVSPLPCLFKPINFSDLQEMLSVYFQSVVDTKPTRLKETGSL